MKRLDQLTQFSKGGSSAASQAAPAPAPVAAVANAPVPVAAPPVTERASEVLMAKRQTRMDAQRRRGYLSTLLAGETGGYKNPFTTGAGGGAQGGKSLLGGG